MNLFIQPELDFTASASVEAYLSEKRSGRISKRAQMVLDILQGAPFPLTATEVWRIAQHNDPDMRRDSIAPRFAQLAAAHLIHKAGRAPCSETGKKITCWSMGPEEEEDEEEQDPIET